MDTREIAKEYRLTHWARIMQERSASGQSIREYCKTAGIQECVYYYWQRRLRETACRELAAQEGSQPGRPVAPEGWMVCAAKDSKPSEPLSIEIGQYRIVVDSGVDAETLAKVCRVLTKLC